MPRERGYLKGHDTHRLRLDGLGEKITLISSHGALGASSTTPPSPLLSSPPFLCLFTSQKGSETFTLKEALSSRVTTPKKVCKYHHRIPRDRLPWQEGDNTKHSSCHLYSGILPSTNSYCTDATPCHATSAKNKRLRQPDHGATNTRAGSKTK